MDRAKIAVILGPFINCALNNASNSRDLRKYKLMLFTTAVSYYVYTVYIIFISEVDGEDNIQFAEHFNENYRVRSIQQGQVDFIFFQTDISFGNEWKNYDLYYTHNVTGTMEHMKETQRTHA